MRPGIFRLGSGVSVVHPGVFRLGSGFSVVPPGFFWHASRHFLAYVPAFSGSVLAFRSCIPAFSGFFAGTPWFQAGGCQHFRPFLTGYPPRLADLCDWPPSLTDCPFDALLLSGRSWSATFWAQNVANPGLQAGVSYENGHFCSRERRATPRTAGNSGNPNEATENWQSKPSETGISSSKRPGFADEPAWNGISSAKRHGFADEPA